MEVNISQLINDPDLGPIDISASVAERGANVGRETWQAANAMAASHPLAEVAEDRAYVRAFFCGFGAWEPEEILAWTDAELDALVLQYAAGDLRELQSLAPGDGLGDIDWGEAEVLSEEGTVSGNIFVSDGKLFIYLGD